MVEQLEPFVNHNDQTQDEWEESVGYAQGNQFHGDAMQFEPWQQGSYNEHNSWYYDRTSWWDKTGQQTSFSAESATVTAAANAASAKTSWTGQRFAAKVSAQEWSAPTQLGTVNQIRKALEQGRTVTQNLIITKDPSVVDEIQQLWNAFEQTQPLTVATVVSNDQTGPTVSVWWDLSKQLTHKPARVKLKLWQASSTNGPIPQKPQILNDFAVSDRPKQVTVRILAPEFYRKLLPGIDHADTPATAITEWSQLLGCRVSQLSGGNWQNVYHKHGCILVGHLKMSLEDAERSILLSGKRGLFFTKVDKNPKALWCEDYFHQAVAKSRQLNKPLVLRQGGHNDLGIVGASVNDVTTVKHKIGNCLGRQFTGPKMM